MAQFTKFAIMQSFVELLEKKSFERITVKDIVEDCGINRKTFYYYFTDIYDLMEQIFKKDTEDFLKSIPPEQDMTESVVQYFRLVAQNRRAVTHLYNSNGKEQVGKYLINSVKETVKINLLQLENARALNEQDIETICEIYTYIFSGYIIMWLENGLRDDPEEYVEKIHSALKGSINLIIDNLKAE